MSKLFAGRKPVPAESSGEVTTSSHDSTAPDRNSGNNSTLRSRRILKSASKNEQTTQQLSIDTEPAIRKRSKLGHRLSSAMTTVKLKAKATLRARNADSTAVSGGKPRLSKRISALFLPAKRTAVNPTAAVSLPAEEEHESEIAAVPMNNPLQPDEAEITIHIVASEIEEAEMSTSLSPAPCFIQFVRTPLSPVFEEDTTPPTTAQSDISMVSTWLDSVLVSAAMATPSSMVSTWHDTSSMASARSLYSPSTPRETPSEMANDTAGSDSSSSEASTVTDPFHDRYAASSPVTILAIGLPSGGRRASGTVPFRPLATKMLSHQRRATIMDMRSSSIGTLGSVASRISAWERLSHEE